MCCAFVAFRHALEVTLQWFEAVPSGTWDVGHGLCSVMRNSFCKDGIMFYVASHKDPKCGMAVSDQNQNPRANETQYNYTPTYRNSS